MNGKGLDRRLVITLAGHGALCECPMMTRDRIGRLAMALLTLGLFGTACQTKNAANMTATKKANGADIDRLFAKWDRADSPGAAVVVVKDEKVIFHGDYGSANLETGTPITSETVFDAASVAKQFTGLAVAMLMEEGKLSLDDDIRKHVADVPEFGKPITIGDLLHHTSGLRDWPETLGLAGFPSGAIINMEIIMEMVRWQRELDFMPGEEYQYCNTSYNLLAEAVRKASGQTFRAWTDAKLFQPLGMTQTHFCEDPTRVIANRAESYSRAGDKFRRNVSQLAAEGSSSLFVTAEDLGKWLVNFQTERVGGKSAFARMYKPGKLKNGKKVDYGFGVALGKYKGRGAINHSGSWAGYRSYVMHLPERKFGVGILANASDIDTSSMARKIADLYFADAAAELAPETPAKPAGKVDPSAWDAYLGTYRLGSGWLLEITREGDQLHAQATREAKFPMKPISDTSFFVPAYGAPVEFVREGSATAKHLVYKGIRAPRLVLPKLSPANTGGYVGDYWSEELRVAYRIELVNGELGARSRSGAWGRLLPTGTDRFDVEGERISVEFTRNPGGEVVEVKVSGGRVRNIRFVKGVLPQRSGGVVAQRSKMF